MEMETDIVIREVEIATDIERKRQRERDKEIECCWYCITHIKLLMVLLLILLLLQV